MSLISDALKEAQRSHSERRGSKSAPELVDTFFPYPEGRKARRSASNGVLMSGAALTFVVLVIVGATWARVRRSPDRLPPLLPQPIVARSVGVAPPAAPVSADSLPAGRVSAAPATVAQPNLSAIAPRRADAHDVAKPAQRDLASPKHAATQVASADTARAVKDSGSAQKVVARAPVQLPPVQQQGVTSPSVRVVVDAGGSRPSDSLFRQAFAEQTRGNFERAKELYERAIALPQASAQTFNNFGVLLLQSGNQLGASEMFKQALKRDDRNVDAWINLGDSYNAIGHHAESMAAFARAAQLDASSVAVRMRLATEYQAIGDTAVAHRMFDEIVQSAPKDAGVHYTYGKFLQTQRDFRGAIREYQSFVELAPGKFSAENIAMIRRYIVTLGQYAK